MGKKIVFGDDEGTVPLVPQEDEEKNAKVTPSEDPTAVSNRSSAPKRYDR